MTIGANLRRLRQQAGLSQPALAEKAGVTQQLISQLERDLQTSTKALPEIARALGVRVEQIDQNYADLTAQPEDPAPAAQRRQWPSIWRRDKQGKEFAEVPEWDRPMAARRKTTSGPLISHEEDEGDRRAVATWQLPAQFVENELGLRPGLTQIVRVRGDSMDDGSASGLVSGDRVFIDCSDTDPRQGGIFAVFDGDGVVVKQVELVRGAEPPQIICTSLNPRYSAFRLTLDGLVHIIGRVAGKITRL